MVKNLKEGANQLVQSMKEMGVKIDYQPKPDDEEEDGFRELIQACKVAFQNFQENQSALQQMIDERDEISREKEDLGFKLEKY